MAKVNLTIDGKAYKAEEGTSLLDFCREQKIEIPTMCEFKGLSIVGACRLCVVDIKGAPRPMPSCATPVAEGQVIETTNEKLKKYRRMVVELFFAERNHVCAVCVANNNCELQTLGYKVGMTHVRFPFLYQKCDVDTSHPEFVMDHNRCILCTRCVRTCDEVEAAHNWDVKGRGYLSRIISDLGTPWGESETCTSCGKCMEACPTGAIWPKSAMEGSLQKHPDMVKELIEKKKVHDE